MIVQDSTPSLCNDILPTTGSAATGTPVTATHAVKEEPEHAEEGVMREYVEKIGQPYAQGMNSPSGKNVGANTGDAENTGEKNTKSIVAGKNDMGGTTKNIARGGTNGDPNGKAIEEPNNEYSKGRGQLKDAGKFANVPGKDSGHTAYKNKEGSYEAGGKGQGNPSGKMAGTGKNSENQGEKNVKSPLKRIGK